MEFGALPPEINSGWIYTGPGSAPMTAAATAWRAVAAELGSTAAGYAAVIARVAGEQWTGPASASMAAAAARYVSWTSMTAAQAEQAATQATAAAAAFDAAFAMTVPPPMIAANRSLLMTLVATNFLGQNTPAIAATEAHYAEMWAQDAAAMYGYAGASAASAQLSAFTNPTGLSAPAAAATQVAGTSAGGNTTVAQLISAMPAALQSLASPLQPASSSTSGLPGILAGLLNPGSVDGMVNAGAWNAASTLSTALGFLSNMGGHAGTAIGSAAAGGLGSASSAGVSGLGALGRGAVSASFGQAGAVGMLSVPPAWAAGAPVSAGAAALPAAVVNTTAESGLAGLPAGVPVGGFGARGGGSTLPHYGFKPTVIPHPVLAG